VGADAGDELSRAETFQRSWNQAPMPTLVYMGLGNYDAPSQPRVLQLQHPLAEFARSDPKSDPLKLRPKRAGHRLWRIEAAAVVQRYSHLFQKSER
jgi:hypothetical protein